MQGKQAEFKKTHIDNDECRTCGDIKGTEICSLLQITYAVNKCGKVGCNVIEEHGTGGAIFR